MKRKWTWMIRIGVSLILIALIVRLVGAKNLSGVFTRIHWPSLVPVVLVLWLSVIIFTWRWSLVLSSCLVEHTFRRLLYLDLWGWLGNIALPTSIAGDTVRIGGFFQERRAHSAAASVLLDRSMAITTQAITAVLASVLFAAGGGPVEYVYIMLVAGAAVLGGFTLIVWASLAGRAPSWLPLRARETLQRLSGVMGDGLRNLARRPVRILHLASLSFGIHLCLATTYLIIFLALDLSPEFLGVFVAVPVAGLISLIPVSIGGLGTREGAFVVFFGALGIAAEDAVAASLIFYFCNVVGCSAGLLLFKLWDLSSPAPPLPASRYTDDGL